MSFRRQQQSGKGIILEENVWLGTDVKVLGGVTTGNDAMVGAGAVVTKNIVPSVLVGGFAAKTVRHRAGGGNGEELE